MSKSTSLSIFKDASFGIKVKDTGIDDENAGVHDSSIKNRMKHSLAQRRTALRSRNINVQGDEINGGGEDKSSLKKKSVLASTNKPVQQKGKSPMMKSELKSISSRVEADTIEQFGEKSTVVEDEPSVGDFSLELDDTVESEAVDSMQSSVIETHANESPVEEFHENNTSEYGEGNEEKMIEAEEQIDMHDDQLAKFIDDMIRSPVLETLEEEELEMDLSAEQHRSPDIERDNGELISVVASCQSINSKSSSKNDQEQLDDEHFSPKSNSVSEASSLTPADSIQTFSLGSAGLTRSQSSGVTPTDSIRTFSIGGRPLDISTDPFKTSIFSPSPVRADEVSMMDSESGTEASPSGQTLIPDVSIRDESQIFTSPNKFMLDASPAAKSNLEDLCRQLEAVRSEQKESGRKMTLSTGHAKDLFKMYDKVHAEVESREVNPISTSQGASPVSKALATGDSSGLSKTAAASLIERNKTLVKEVRFADQTCVELSERNSSMARQIEKMDKDEVELKSKNDSLHDAVVRASQASARAEEGLKETELKRNEERKRFELQLQAANASLKEKKDKNKMLSDKLAESNAAASHSDQLVAAITAKYEAISDEHLEAKETISSLRQRLVTIESTAELASSAAAQKYREASYEMQNELQDLQDEYETCISELNEEKEARRNAEEEVSDLKEFCDELEVAQRETQSAKQLAPAEVKSTPAQVSSPCSTYSQASGKTRASTILAKTLKVELERGHDATERIIESERIIAVTQSKLRETERDLKFAKKEISSLRNKLQKDGRKAKAQSPPNANNEGYDDDSSVETENTANRDMSKKLLEVRTECNEYKRELDCIITQIQGIESDDISCSQASASSKPNTESDSLMQTVKDLAQVCTRVNVAAGDRVGELEERIRFLTQSMNQLNAICVEDQSNASGVSMSLQMMEEGTSTPVKGNKTPMKFLFMEDNDNTFSPVGMNSLLTPQRENTPVKVVRLRNELSAAEEQLKTVSDEKDSLESALVEARVQIELLSSSAQEAIASAIGKKELLEEKSELEKSVLGLRSQIEQLESRIESLEEDKAYLFDDAAAHVDELEEAKSKIDVLQKEARDASNFLQQRSEEKQSIRDELTDVNKLHRNEIGELKDRNSELEVELSAAEEQIKTLSVDMERKISSLRELEASRDRFQEKIQMITSENDNNVDMIHQLQESLSETIQQANELKASFMNCNEELAQSIEENHELHSTNNQLQSTIHEQQNELEIKSTGQESLSNEFDQVKEKLSMAEDAYDSLHEELLKMGSKVEVLTDVNDEYEAELTEAAELRNNMQNELDVYISKITSLANDLSATKRALQETEESSAKTKSYLEHVEQRFDDVEAEAAERNDNMDIKIKSKDEELNLLRAHFSEVETNLALREKREMEMSREHEIEFARLKTELEEKTKELAQQSDNHRVTSRNL